MAVEYLPPGSYTEEVIVPRAGVPTGLERRVCIVGKGKKTKRVRNEAVRRGSVKGEVLTVSASSPHSATLANSPLRRKELTVLYRDGEVLPADGFEFQGVKDIVIADEYYVSGAVYTIDYVAVDSVSDILEYSNVGSPRVKSIVSVGSYPNVGNYREGKDFRLVTDLLSWDLGVSASFVGLDSEPFDLSGGNNKIKIRINGVKFIEISIVGSDMSAVTAAEVVSSINSALAGDSDYGSDYSSVAGVEGGKVKLIAPSFVKEIDGQVIDYYGENTTIEFMKPSAGDATGIVFGLSFVDRDLYIYYGSGRRPVPGGVYYVTYEYERGKEEYNVVKVFYTDNDFYADIGYPEVGNDLAIAGYIAFLQGVGSIAVCQVEDADGDGVYTELDYLKAIDATENSRNFTELVVVGRSSEGIRARILSNVEKMSVGMKKGYRRGWVGVSRGTTVGNADYVGSLVYIAKRELNVGPNSPARGRLILTAPSSWKVDIETENRRQVTVDVDSTFASVACAARMCTLEVWDTLLRKDIVGLRIDEEYSEAERDYLASSGVNVMVSVGGRVIFFDPKTTEQGGRADFEEIQASLQKDNIRIKVDNAVENQLVGLVPGDLDDFLITIKQVVGSVIVNEINAGNLAPYLDENGAVRVLNYEKDIQAFRSKSDPRRFYFRYWVNLRYPAVRFFGSFSVDVPFFRGE